MASVVVNGDVSGSVTLQAPSAAGTVTVTLPSASGTMAVLPASTSVLAESSGGTGTTTGYYGFKNRIINGAMVINQRAFSGTPTNGQYTLDRFNVLMPVASKFTVAQSSTAPSGFVNSLLVTSSSAYTVGASEAFGIQQVIEGYNCADLMWGTANAKTVTLSFWVYSSLTGTFGGALQNYASDRCYPFSYTISSANTWTQASVTIAGDTTGTWTTTNSGGIALIFSMGTGATKSGTAGVWGSTYYTSTTGATSVVGTSGATFYLTGVQLEKGSTATSFDYRPYGTELALCQRYFCVFNGSGGFAVIGSGVFTDTSNARVMVVPPVEMRANPTGGQTSTNVRCFNGSTTVDNAGFASISQPSTRLQFVNFSGSASFSAAQPAMVQVYNDGTGKGFTLSAEL